MSPQSPRPIDDTAVISLIKEISGKRIEGRRRRDHISQTQLALAVGRSERWLREIEAGIPTSRLEDHVRCAHSLRMSTAHILIPLLCVEHNMPIPRELLELDDLWEVEQACLAIIAQHQAAAETRQALQSACPAIQQRG
jgi:transcriptional regulator with XRE-family HTH domain